MQVNYLKIYLEKGVGLRFKITPKYQIQVTATKTQIYFQSNSTLFQSYNETGKVTHMDVNQGEICSNEALSIGLNTMPPGDLE